MGAQKPPETIFAPPTKTRNAPARNSIAIYNARAVDDAGLRELVSRCLKENEPARQISPKIRPITKTSVTRGLTELPKIINAPPQMATKKIPRPSKMIADNPIPAARRPDTGAFRAGTIPCDDPTAGILCAFAAPLVDAIENLQKTQTTTKNTSVATTAADRKMYKEVIDSTAASVTVRSQC